MVKMWHPWDAHVSCRGTEKCATGKLNLPM